ncbi:hypothetical protein [Rhizohabitans arisaemae]|uniref:hypothetical protein n=1 Tax=Rhizohabitans arisaemae TaxID=2720610 RepID=UPI0024B07255|nr:hypothetical protein [Rhizohabitans arisaemae]
MAWVTDPFSAVERHTFAAVRSPQWTNTPQAVRTRALAPHMLCLPDGAFWFFGTLARWYRRHPADGGWHLCPPPMTPMIRTAARAVGRYGSAPAVPAALVPAGPDFAFRRGSFQAFVGPDVPAPVVDGVRAVLTDLRRTECARFPVGWPMFADDVPSPVAAVWGTIMWCSYAPIFDGNERLLTMFGEFLARPLPGDEWVRRLPPIPLTALTGLYGGRLRAGDADAAHLLLTTMVRTASVLCEDPRFSPRAEALLSMARPALARPDLDADLAEQGEPALVRGWLSRCPPHLAPATSMETSPGEHLRHSVYDLAQALSYADPRVAGYLEARLAAISLIGADICAVKPDLAAPVATWLEPELGAALSAVVEQPGHPLRGCWPQDGTLPAHVSPPGREATATVLGASYAASLAWCRLTGIPVPEQGFTTSAALVRQLIHHRDDPLPPSR